MMFRDISRTQSAEENTRHTPKTEPIGMATHEGVANKANEDAHAGFSITYRGGRVDVLVVADGVTGEDDGEQASHLAVSTVQQSLEESLCMLSNRPAQEEFSTLLGKAVVRADQAIKARARRNVSGMSTTLVVALVADFDLYVANVGDSRAYLHRDDTLQLITRDHTYVEEMVQRGRLNRAQASRKANRNVLTQSLGPGPAPVVDQNHLLLHAGDRVLLCTDGLTSRVTEPQISRVLGYSKHSLQKRTELLIEQALEMQETDNITAVLYAVPGNGQERRAGTVVRLGVVLCFLVILFAVAYLNMTGSNASVSTLSAPDTTDAAAKIAAGSPATPFYFVTIDGANSTSPVAALPTPETTSSAQARATLTPVAPAVVAVSKFNRSVAVTVTPLPTPAPIPTATATHTQVPSPTSSQTPEESTPEESTPEESTPEESTPEESLVAILQPNKYQIHLLSPEDGAVQNFKKIEFKWATDIQLSAEYRLELVIWPKRYGPDGWQKGRNPGGSRGDQIWETGVTQETVANFDAFLKRNPDFIDSAYFWGVLAVTDASEPQKLLLGDTAAIFSYQAVQNEVPPTSTPKPTEPLRLQKSPTE